MSSVSLLSNCPPYLPPIHAQPLCFPLFTTEPTLITVLITHHELSKVLIPPTDSFINFPQGLQVLDRRIALSLPLQGLVIYLWCCSDSKKLKKAVLVTTELILKLQVQPLSTTDSTLDRLPE